MVFQILVIDGYMVYFSAAKLSTEDESRHALPTHQHGKVQMKLQDNGGSRQPLSASGAPEQLALCSAHGFQILQKLSGEENVKPIYQIESSVNVFSFRMFDKMIWTLQLIAVWKLPCVLALVFWQVQAFDQ